MVDGGNQKQAFCDVSGQLSDNRCFWGNLHPAVPARGFDCSSVTLPEVHMKRSIVRACGLASAGVATAAFAGSVGPRTYNTNVAPSDFNAYLTTDDGGVYAQPDAGWGTSGGGFKIAWVITPLAGAYRYEYTMTNASGGDLARELSHFIIELSEGVLAGDLRNLSTTGTPNEVNVGVQDPHDGNPEMPTSIYGVRVDDHPSPSQQTFSFEINRPPVWGNFYTKDGHLNQENVFAYNAGFSTTAGAGGYFIARPDTVIIPLPAALWAGVALIGAAGVLSHKR